MGGLDDGKHALRVVGGGEPAEGPFIGELDRDAGRRQACFERLPARSSFQRRTRQHLPDDLAGGEGLLDEADPLGEREPAPFPASAQPEIPNQSVQRVTH